MFQLQDKKYKQKKEQSHLVNLLDKSNVPKDRKRPQQVNLDYEFTCHSLRQRVLSKAITNEQLLSDESRKLVISQGGTSKPNWCKSKDKKEMTKIRSKSGVISNRYQWKAP